MERINVMSPFQITFENGILMTTKRLDTASRPQPGTTAKHEAGHVIAAGEISIQP